MHSPSILSSALAARLLFMIPLVIRGSFATSTTTIQAGDTFLAIAHSAGIPVESLEAANPGVAASALYVGQVINIPTDNGPAASAPLSNPSSQTAAAAVSTTLATLASPPVTSPSGSPLGNPSLIAEAGLAVESSSSAGSSMNTMTVLSSTASSPIPTSSPAPSTTAVASNFTPEAASIALSFASQEVSSRLSSTAAVASTSTSAAISSPLSSTPEAASTSTSQVASSRLSSTSAPASSETTSIPHSSVSAIESTSTSQSASSSHSSTTAAASTSTSAAATSTPSSTAAASSTSTSAPPSTSSTAAPSTSPPPAATTTTPTDTTPSSVPNSPPVASCAPSPPGKFHDVDKDTVKKATKKFCDGHQDVQLEDLLKTPLDGSDQSWNKDNGSSNNEAGFNLTVTAIPNCSLRGSTVGYPLLQDPDSNCTSLLFNSWRNCDNKGMGGSITAGCIVYLLLEDH